jgi:CBS domain-containing protein
MRERAPDKPDVAPAASPDAASREPGQKDHFLTLMFFQGHHGADDSHGPRPPDRAAGDYAPLRHSTAGPGERYRLPLPSAPAPVRLDSPATAVMTDLRRIEAVTIEPAAPIDDANRTMIARGVRALFVVDETRRMHGIITSTDVLGERPIQFAQERGIRRGEVVARDIMTPADRLEILDIADVERARVGDVVATLKLAGRQHAVAVENDEPAAGGQKTVRGIFSLTQIARQLGIAPQPFHDIARTFAEIEAVIAS